jgi:hypothetical protein
MRYGMIRRGISSTVLVLVVAVMVVAIVEAALFLISFPNALQLALIADVPVAVIVGGVAFLLRRRGKLRVVQSGVPQATGLDKLRKRNGGRRAPHADETAMMDKTEGEEADVFLGEDSVGKSAENVDTILSSMRARDEDTNLGVRPAPGIEPHMHQKTAQVLAEEPAEEMEKRPSEREYQTSPDALKIPAYICRCGHAHRFLCLICGMNVETAIKKKNMHWVEWTPDMLANP